MASEFSYIMPPDEEFAHTLKLLLERTAPFVAQLLANKDCSLHSSSQFSRQRWDAYWAALHVSVPIEELDRFTEPVKSEILRAACQIMPPSCGYDLMHLEIAPKLVSFRAGHDLEHIDEAASRMALPNLLEQIKRLRASDSDPRLMIGTSKELIETSCKAILREREPGLDTRALDFHPLVKACLNSLQLVPDETVTGSSSIRRMVTNLASVAQCLGEIRNLHGSGHGPDGKEVGLEFRHAKLAVGTAITLGTFLIESHLDDNP